MSDSLLIMLGNKIFEKIENVAPEVYDMILRQAYFDYSAGLLLFLIIGIGSVIGGKKMWSTNNDDTMIGALVLGIGGGAISVIGILVCGY